MLRIGFLDSNAPAGNDCRANEAAHLHKIGPNTEFCAVQPFDAMNGQQVRANALDLCAALDEEIAQVLHMWLGGRVSNNRCPFGESRRHDRIFGSGYAGLIQQYIRALQPISGHVKTISKVDGRAKSLQCQNMCVQPPPPDNVTARRGEF